jgi:ribosomal protein L2
MQLRHIPVGSIVHNVEMKAGKGGQLARSAGSSVSFTAREGIYAYLRLKSGETRKVHIDCRATLGEVGNDEHNLRSYGKAGAKRWLGIRPTVPRVAMGSERQGPQDPSQQAHGQHDRSASQEPDPLMDRPLTKHVAGLSANRQETWAQPMRSSHATFT